MQHQLLKPHFALHLANNKAYLKLLNHVRRRQVFGWHAFAGENFECCWTNKRLKWIQRNFMRDELLFYFVFTLWKGMQKKNKYISRKKNKGPRHGKILIKKKRWVAGGCWSQGVTHLAIAILDIYIYIYNIILINV